MKFKNHFMKLAGKVILMLFVFALCQHPTVTQAAVKYIDMDSTVTSSTSVKLTWRKKSGVKKYKLLVTYVDNNKYKKTVTIKGSSKSYTFKKLKSGKEYTFKLYGYNRKGKKIYSASSYNYTGFESPHFGSSGDSSGDGGKRYCTNMEYPDRIDLRFSPSDTGIPADRIQIYRKEDSGSYKLLATVKASTKSYTDKKVAFGKQYTYKLRSYYVKKGKRHYSKYSYALTLTAINSCGIYTMYTLTELGVPTKEIIVKLCSDSKNGTLQFYPDTFDVTPGDKEDPDHYPADMSDNDIPTFQMMNISQISLDGDDWTDCPDTIELLAGHSIYLKYNLPVERTLTTSGSISCEMGTLHYIGGGSQCALLYFTNDANGYTATFDEYRE